MDTVLKSVGVMSVCDCCCNDLQGFVKHRRMAAFELVGTCYTQAVMHTHANVYVCKYTLAMSSYIKQLSVFVIIVI